MDLVKTIHEILRETVFIPVKKGERIELWERQPDGNILPTGLYIRESMIYVEVTYDKRDVVITEDGFTEEEVENHMVRELEGIVAPLKKLGFEKKESKWLSASDKSERDMLVVTFARTFELHQLRRILDALTIAMEEMEMF